MSSTIATLNPEQFPPLLKEIPQPPKTLWYSGVLPPAELKLLAVVGSRQYTAYGKQVVEMLLAGLKNYPLGIVSGLALGIDSLAHEAAMKNGLYTLAVPGSGLAEDVIYPASHRGLAKKILSSGGGLLSEFPPDTPAAPWTFPKRNRIMAGLSHATLLIEASERSGTLITARLAVDFNRELLAVPGNLFAKNSYGTHQFLKLGATMVTEAKDILYALGIDPAAETATARVALSPLEEKVISILSEPTDRDSLIRTLGLSTSEAGILLMQMEMGGHIKYVAPHYISLV